MKRKCMHNLSYSIVNDMNTSLSLKFTFLKLKVKMMAINLTRRLLFDLKKSIKIMLIIFGFNVTFNL